LPSASAARIDLTRAGSRDYKLADARAIRYALASAIVRHYKLCCAHASSLAHTIAIQ